MSDALPELDKECFVISPIGAAGSPERERNDGVLEFVIARAAEELGLTAVRGDQLAEPGQITLQVIDHILGAKAAVADLTGLNPNVFYELAVRHTARLPVALIAERDCKLPFDIAQMRTIFFESTNLRSSDQARKDIVTHLRQAVTGGAVDSPIATSIDVRALAGGSAAERNIAEIVTTIEDVAKMQRTIASRVDRIVYRVDEIGFGGAANEAFLQLLDLLRNMEGRLAAIKDAMTDRNLPEYATFGPPLRDLTANIIDAQRFIMRRVPVPPLRTEPPDVAPEDPEKPSLL